MRIRKLRGNERCPCKSGKKHKRCCREWYVDDKGRIIPPNIATDPVLKYRDALIEHSVEAGLLPCADLNTMCMDLFDELCERGLGVAMMIEVGIAGDILLWFERCGRMMPRHVWTHWVATGELVLRNDPGDETLTLWVNTLGEILHTFAPREFLLGDDGYPIPCEVVQSHAIVVSPQGSEAFDREKDYGIGLVVDVSRGNDSLWPDSLLHPAVALGIPEEDWDGATGMALAKLRAAGLTPALTRLDDNTSVKRFATNTESITNSGAGSCGATHPNDND
jgi:hypothetical protein